MGGSFPYSLLLLSEGDDWGANLLFRTTEGGGGSLLESRSEAPVNGVSEVCNT